MKKIHCAIAIISAINCTTAANAGWQYSDWNMSSATVVKASNGKAVLDDGLSSDQTTDGKLSVMATGKHQSGKYHFRAVFYFDNDNLALVKLKRLDDTGCGSLGMDLRSAYGEPASESRGIAQTVQWHSAKDNNRVVLVEIGKLCLLEYYPLKNENNSGL